MINNNEEIFWGNEPGILFDWNRLSEIIPKSDMTPNQKLNAISRLILFGGIITYLYQMDLKVLLITGIGLYITYLLNRNIETFKEDDDESDEYFNEKDTKCKKVTEENPFMNVLPDDYENNPNRKEACSHSSEKVRDKVRDVFFNKMPKDANDPFGRNNSFRQFYSMPATTIPNDRDSFLKWTYNLSPTCKEGGILPKRDVLFNN